MEDEVVFYICPICFDITETPPDRRGHQVKLVRCQPGKPGDERRKPPVDEHGHVLTRAPRWYLEAIGVIKTEV